MKVEPIAQRLTPWSVTVRGPLVGLLMMFGSMAFSCDKGADDASAQGSAKVSAESAATSPIAGVDAILKDYEAIRALLAADKTDGIAVAARRVADSVETARASAPENMKKPLQDLAGAAGKLATSLADIERARIAFGELSRAYVELLAAAPSLRKGRYVFDCPMAKGYSKWVQVSAEMANPYMGKRMLECGSRATWIP